MEGEISRNTKRKRVSWGHSLSGKRREISQDMEKK
jgi:hypothetical protein